MARKPMITRTFHSTRATALVCDLATRTPFEKVYDLPRIYDKPKDMVDAIELTETDPTIKLITVLSTEEVETLRGMSEEDFMRYSKVLPPRTASADTASADTASADTASADTASADTETEKEG